MTQLAESGVITTPDQIHHAFMQATNADDIALSSATWTAEIALPDGTVVRQEGITAEVSRRQPDGTWKLVIDDPRFV